MANIKDFPQIQDLYQAARKTLDQAYAPYSKFQVGAAVRATNGALYSGCNVENASYGGTVCAERVAIWKAVSEGQRSFSEVLVVVKGDEIWSPCGMCRQVMAEFCQPKSKVYLTNLKGELKVFDLDVIFPMAFGPEQLKSN